MALRYADVRPVIVYRTEPLIRVASEMIKRHRFHALVLDEDDLPWGVISSRDIATALFIIADEGVEILEAGTLGKIIRNPVQYYSSHPPIMADPEISLEEAVAIMISNNIGCLPLVENSRLAGLLDEKSVARALPDYSRQNICEITSWNPITIDPDEEIMAAVGVMLSLNIRRLVVPGDPHHKLVSINTVLEYIFREENREKLLKGDSSILEENVSIIAEKPWEVDCSYTLREVASIITFDPLGAVIVEKEKGEIGLLTERDLVVALAKELIK